MWSRVARAACVWILSNRFVWNHQYHSWQDYFHRVFLLLNPRKTNGVMWKGSHKGKLWHLWGSFPEKIPKSAKKNVTQSAPALNRTDQCALNTGQKATLQFGRQSSIQTSRVAPVYSIITILNWSWFEGSQRTVTAWILHTGLFSTYSEWDVGGEKELHLHIQSAKSSLLALLLWLNALPRQKTVQVTAEQCCHVSCVSVQLPEEACW